MHLVAFAPSFDSLDLCVDALALLTQRGSRVEVVFASPNGLPAGSLAPSNLGIRHLSPGSDAQSQIHFARAADEIASSDPDIVFLCDERHPLSARFCGLLSERRWQGLVVGAQADFATLPTGKLNADRLLCFGERQEARLKDRLGQSAHVAGLPRLDRLRGVTPGRGGYAVFIAHDGPEAPIITATLAAFEKSFNLPVATLENPGSPGAVRHQSSKPLPFGVSSGPIQLLRNAEVVLATCSPRILDALYLRKPVVLLPNAGLTAFDGYPGISRGFTPPAIEAALRVVLANPSEVTQYLREVIGGIRFDHAESVCAVLERLLKSGPLRSATASRSTDASHDSRPLPRLETRADLVAFLPSGGVAVELGVAKGVFSDEMLRARKDFHLYSVDRWAGDRGHDDEEYNAARELLGVHGDRCTIIRKSFEEALADFAPECCDLIYLDGYAHDGQQGGKTIEDWWSRLKVGGILAGHDYHPDWRATVEAVDEFCRKHRLTVQTTSGDFFPSWYLRKPNE